MPRQVPARFALTTLAAAVLSVVATPLWAQDAEPAPDQPSNTVESIVVTGTRASLAKSLELKRNASRVQDSISATELGRFPDDNVADSLSHITGVAISRTAGGEGLKVSVRGLGPGYSLVTLNSRILATDDAGRDFAFDVLPADVIGGADVVKSAQASLTEGAIGGLVNLRSAHPFDEPGRHALVRAETDYNTMSRLSGNKVSAVYSDTFADNTMGVLIGAVLAHRKVRTDSAGYTYFRGVDLNGDGTMSDEDLNLAGTCCMTFGSIMEDKKRTAVSAAFEWRPNADVKMVLDGLYTQLDSPQVGYNQAYFPNWVDGRWSDMQVTNGVVTAMTVKDLVPEIANITTDRIVDTTQFGWNGSWQATPDLVLTGDAYQSTSTRLGGGKDTYVVAQLAGRTTGYWANTGQVLPHIRVQLEDGRDLATALAAGQLGDANFGPHYVGLHGDDVHDTINGASTGGRWAIDSGIFDQLHFGWAGTDRTKKRDYFENDFTNGSVQYSGSESTTFASMGAHVVQHAFTLPNFMPGAGSGFPTSFVAFDVPAYLEALKKLDGQPNPNGGVFDYRKTLPVLNPVQSYRVKEKTDAAYLQLDLAREQWSGDVGVRLVHTSTQSASAYNQIISITPPPPNDPTGAYFVEYSPAVPINVSGSYTKALPAANFLYHLNKALQMRLGVAETIARPSVDQLAPTRTDGASWGADVIWISGDPHLKPYTAWQQDVSLEWYYAPKSALNGAVFAKQIKNFITATAQENVDIGVPGHLFTIVSPINGDKATVLGFEVGWQHLLDNGFGIRAQYTYNKTRSWVDGELVGELEGVAPASSSLGLLYEKGPISLNLSADYTSPYTVTSGTELGVPSKAKAVTWVTAQASYEFNGGFKLTLEGRNLTNAQERTDLGRRDLPYTYNAYGRSFTLGASLKF